MTVEGACDGDVFRAFVAHVLGQRLRPGPAVAMVHLSVHKVQRPQSAGHLGTDRGAGSTAGLPAALVLRPRSELRSLGQGEAKVKIALRAAKVLALEVPEPVESAAPAIITVANAHHSFRDSGYAAH